MIIKYALMIKLIIKRLMMKMSIKYALDMAHTWLCAHGSWWRWWWFYIFV